MKRFYSLCFITLFLRGGSSLCAQTLKTFQTLSLKDILELTNEKHLNVSVQSKLYDFEIAQKNRRVAFREMLPPIDVSLSYNYVPLSWENDKIPDVKTLTLGVSVSYPVSMIPVLWKKFQIERLNQTNAFETLKNTQDQHAYALLKTFLNCQKALKQWQLVVNLKKTLKKQIAAAKTRHKLGQLTDLDYETLILKYDEVVIRQDALETAYRSCLSAFDQEFGLTVQNLVLVDDLDMIQNRLSDNKPTIPLRDQEEWGRRRQIAQLGYEIARQQILPRVAVFGRWSRPLSDSLKRPAKNDFVFGIQASWTFDYGIKWSQMEISSIKRKQLDLMLENDSKMRQQRIENLMTRIVQTFKDKEYQKKRFENAQKSLKNIELAYERGLKSDLDLSDKRSETSKVESELFQASIDYNISLLDFYREIGLEFHSLFKNP